MKLGVVGTGWISGQFVAATHEEKAFDVSHVYSRREESAMSFARQYGIETATSTWESFCEMDFDVAYIGTPNATHVALALDLVRAGKHVIVEKPAFLNLKEWLSVHQLAHEKGVFVFEAARHYYEVTFESVTRAVRQNWAHLQGASLSYAKYSSKMDDFLHGKIASSLSLTMGGGALMDLGVYPLYNAIAWFGLPVDCHYDARLLSNGIDVRGTIILEYPTFNVTIQIGKDVASHAPQEIYFGERTLRLDACQQIGQFQWYMRDELVSEAPPLVYDNPMRCEVREIATIIKEGNLSSHRYLTATSVSQNVITVMDKLRRDVGIIFESEKGE